MVAAAPEAQVPTTIIRHATVVDVASGRLLRDHAVLVRGDLIERVGPDATLGAATPRGAPTVAAGGRVLIPGLWDMHVHALWDPIVTTTVLPLMVTDGITGVPRRGRRGAASHVAHQWARAGRHHATVQAAAAGIASIEHMRAALGGCCTRATAAACTPIIAAFRAHGTWQVPTLGVRRARAELDDPARIADPRLALVPGALRAQWLAARERRLAQKGPDDVRRMRAEFADHQWLAGLLHRERIALLAGSDAGADFSSHGSGLHDELRELVRAGLSPLESLQAATIRTAAFLGQTGRTGQVVAGAPADLVLLEANPLDDITSVARIHAVMSRGTWIARPESDRLRAASRAAAQ